MLLWRSHCDVYDLEKIGVIFFWKLQNPPLGCRGSRFSPKWPWSRFLTQMTFNDIYVTYMLGSMALLWHSHSDTYDFWPLSKCFFEPQIPPSRVQRVQIFIYQMQMTMIQIPGHKWPLMTYTLGSMALLWRCHNDTYTLSRIFYIYTWTSLLALYLLSPQKRGNL